MTSASFRYLQQPGPASDPRRLGQVASTQQDWLITLREGDDLMEGLTRCLSDQGERQGGIILLHGSLQRVVFTTGRADETGHRVATPHGPFEREGPFAVIGGNAILGRGPHDESFLHCHALLATPQGEVFGGHLRPGLCPLGPEGLKAMAACPRGTGFKVAPDDETNFSIFRLIPSEVGL